MAMISELVHGRRGMQEEMPSELAAEVVPTGHGLQLDFESVSSVSM